MRKAFNAGLMLSAAQLRVNLTIDHAAEGMSVSSGTLETDIGVGFGECKTVFEAFVSKVDAFEPDFRVSGS